MDYDYSVELVITHHFVLEEILWLKIFMTMFSTNADKVQLILIASSKPTIFFGSLGLFALLEVQKSSDSFTALPFWKSV